MYTNKHKTKIVLQYIECYYINRVLHWLALKIITIIKQPVDVFTKYLPCHGLLCAEKCYQAKHLKTPQHLILKAAGFLKEI